jgi:hypothetical protein
MRVFAFVVGLALLGGSTSAHADPPEILWPETNPRFHWAEYGFTGALIVFNIFNEQLLPGLEHELWHGGILTDESLDRWATGIDKPINDGFTHFGDYAMWGLVAFPFIIDAVLVSWLLNDSPDVAFQVTLISTEALMTSSLLNAIAKKYVTRNRPATPRCDETFEECPRGSAIHSFYSGHAAQAFAAAGVICANHVHLQLFRHRGADLATCGIALGFATASAVSRVTNRSHYASDVFIGSAIGLALGYAMPVLFHYRDGVISPMAGEMIGVGYTKSF